MEAHNGLSAKIVEEAGFKGIWGSGLSLSAAMGVRDNNEASWTQVLEVLEFMSDATTIPILLDGDTGYGNFNNMRRLVQKLEQRGVAGVCIEDKLFPKTNSFISGETQPLADMNEFCGKIKAAKDTQLDEDFVLVARIEAFIAGWGLNEALKRAEAYRRAGADAILVHSKKRDSSDIEAFMKEWGDRHPIVIVPTKYYSTPTDKFRDLGISTAIWANHNVRTSITAMQALTKDIYENETLRNVEGKIVSVAEIFRLQGAGELQEAEKKYLPTSQKSINSIILAPSQGDLGVLTQDIPKALLKVGDKSILSDQIDKYNTMGIKDITVVRGFAKDKINATNINTVDNDEWAETREVYSLHLAQENIKENTVISFGDIVFKDYILNELLNDNNDITIVADADYEHKDDQQDFVTTNKPYSKKIYFEDVKLKSISANLKRDAINGEFIGLWKVSDAGSIALKDTLNELSKQDNFKKLTLNDLFTALVAKTEISVQFIKGSWLDIDTIVDLENARNL